MEIMAIKLKATKRDDLTRSATKQLRDNGFIPSVVYGKDKDSLSVSIKGIELIKTIRDEGRNAIITLEIADAEAVQVMLHEYQVDRLTQNVTHADFYIVDMTIERDFEVSINLVGEPIGAKEGGIIQQPLYELAIRAMPSDIPDEIAVDISNLDIGDTIVVSDLVIDGNYEITTEDDATVVTMTAPMSEEELEALDAPSDDVSVEPELVDQKGEDEEEEIE